MVGAADHKDKPYQAYVCAGKFATARKRNLEHVRPASMGLSCF